MNSLIFILILVIPGSLLLLAGFTVLQAYLSLRKSFWPGLVLPALNLLTLIVPFVLSLLSSAGRGLSLIFFFAAVSLLFNLVTYLVCRRRLQRNARRELQKMSIQDLG